MRGALLGGAVALSILGTSAIASADITKSQCVDANTYGQTLRREGKLTAARGQFQLCNDPKCPEVVRTDCTQRLDELETAFPGIIFDVKKADGGDVVDVKIAIDGKVVAEKLDGTPLRVDPGSHEFSFEITGEKALIRTFVLKEGEKTRTERILFVGPEGPPQPVKPAVTPPPAQPASGGPNGDVLRYAGLGVAAVGVVAIGAGVFYGLKASSKWSDQKDDCASATDCKNHPQALSDHDGAVVWGRFSSIGFITGGVLLAGGVALFLFAPKSETAKTGMAKTLQGVRASSDSLSFSF